MAKLPTMWKPPAGTGRGCHTVTDVLKYVSYQREELVARVRRFAELAVRASRMSLEETRSMLRMYEEGLAGYTYLERA